MAFIEELGNKITSASQKTAKTVTDLTQGVKLKSAISTEQNQLTELYATMGKIYFERYGDVAQKEGIASLCDRIHAAQAKIAALETELVQVQNMKACPSCGAKSAAASLFCPQCGYAFPKGTEPAASIARFCTNCGASLLPAAAFCVECGQPQAHSPMETPEASAASTSESPHFITPGDYRENSSADSAAMLPGGAEPKADPPTAARPQAEIAASENDAEAFCVNCGAALDRDAIFCVECGTKAY